MKSALDAFRLAHRKAKVTGIVEALGPMSGLPSQALERLAGHWEEHILARSVLILRSRGVPEPRQGPVALFNDMVLALKSCKEVSNDDPDSKARRKPAP